MVFILVIPLIKHYYYTVLTICLLTSYIVRLPAVNFGNQHNYLQISYLLANTQSNVIKLCSTRQCVCYCFSQQFKCVIKQLLDSIFAISEVPEVKISFILDITKTSSNKFCSSACIISTLFTTHSGYTEEGGQNTDFQSMGYPHGW